MDKINRGGVRQGAGRPLKENKKILVTVRLPIDLVQFLDEQAGTKSHLIEISLRQLRDRML